MAEERFRMRLDPTSRSSAGQKPYMEWVGGPHPYLWVGDDKNGCYGTCEAKQLKRLAKVVLADD